jgi:predicted nucleotidyltransferase
MIENLEEKYNSLLEKCKTDENILGLFLGGSRGKDDSFITKDSDIDVYVIISDTASKELKEELKQYGSEKFEVVAIMDLAEFRQYANWGGDRGWERYNFAHNEAIIDKTGEIQKLMSEKGNLPPHVQKEVVSEALGGYFNQVYRSAKYTRDGKEFSAYLDASEGMPLLMTLLYGLEGRVRPYNKYFEWELHNHPLKLLPCSADEFIADYKHILLTGDFETQSKIFKAVKRLLIDNGFEADVEEWKELYFVGE